MKTTNKSAQVPSLGIALCLLLVLVSTSFAGSATWQATPATGDWNTATNWTPQTVPNGVSDVATFQQSSVTSISTSAVINVGDIVFDTNASDFTITVRDNFLIDGTGIIFNNPSAFRTQTFVCPPPAVISFLKSAAVGGECL
jgi:hypothetical protein